MRRLFLKIFAILWLAQSLIFVISTTLIVRQRFPGPSTLSDALDSNLRHDGELGLRTYEAGGCSGFTDNSQRHEPSGAMLLTESPAFLTASTDAWSAATGSGWFR